MQRYLNLGGNSSVRAYFIGNDFIDVQFVKGNSYRYSYRTAGIDKVEQMKKLAQQGYGLNTYIKCYANNDYEK